jgi:hypothetical protein
MARPKGKKNNTVESDKHITYQLANVTNSAKPTPLSDNSITLRSNKIISYGTQESNSKRQKLESITATKTKLFQPESIPEITEIESNDDNNANIETNYLSRNLIVSKDQHDDAEETDDSRQDEDEVESMLQIDKNADIDKTVVDNNDSFSLLVNAAARTSDSKVSDEAQYFCKNSKEQKKGKEEMLKHLTDKENISIRMLVRSRIFHTIKFIGPEKLGEDSSIIDLLFKQIGVNDKEVKKQKFLGVRYVLQRQINTKRSYCTDKITKACLGRFCVCCNY